MKLGQVKKIKFWTLRNEVGPCGGVILDKDFEVERKCMVVIGCDGLKLWQIVKSHINQSEWDYYIDLDRECLDEYTFEELCRLAL